MATGRYFLGVEVPTVLCGPELLALQKRIEPHLHVKRWYRAEQMHLTLHFLGHLEDAQVSQLMAQVEPAVAPLHAFELELGHTGWFPQAKVVWCGVGGNLTALHRLQRSVVSALATDFDVESSSHDAYRAHITLGRIHNRDADFSPERVDDPPRGIAWTVDRVHLFESVSTGSTGPEYPIRHTFSLQTQ